MLVAVGVPAALGVAAGLGAGAVNGYLLNRGWTFAGAPRGGRHGGRYVAVQALGAGARRRPRLAALSERMPRLPARSLILPS